LLQCVLQCIAVYCSVMQSWQRRGNCDCVGGIVCCSVCCTVLQCFAVYCSVMQSVTLCCAVLQCVAVRCDVLQCVAVCCNVLQCVAVCCSVVIKLSPDLRIGRQINHHTEHTATHCNTLQHIATHGIFHTITVQSSLPVTSHLSGSSLAARIGLRLCGSCSVLQCVAVCCSVLQCVADQE